jgi:hypothetical protein
VSAVLAYSLGHKEEVDEHLKQREAEAEQLRQKIESRQQPDNATLRARLLARSQAREEGASSPWG